MFSTDGWMMMYVVAGAVCTVGSSTYIHTYIHKIDRQQQ